MYVPIIWRNRHFNLCIKAFGLRVRYYRQWMKLTERRIPLREWTFRWLFCRWNFSQNVAFTKSFWLLEIIWIATFRTLTCNKHCCYRYEKYHRRWHLTSFQCLYKMIMESRLLYKMTMTSFDFVTVSLNADSHLGDVLLTASCILYVVTLSYNIITITMHKIWVKEWSQLTNWTPLQRRYAYLIVNIQNTRSGTSGNGLAKKIVLLNWN